MSVHSSFHFLPRSNYHQVYCWIWNNTILLIMSHCNSINIYNLFTRSLKLRHRSLDTVHLYAKTARSERINNGMYNSSNHRYVASFVSLGKIFHFMLWQHCANGLVGFRYKTHLVRKRWFFGSKYLYWSLLWPGPRGNPGATGKWDPCSSRSQSTTGSNVFLHSCIQKHSVYTITQCW